MATNPSEPYRQTPAPFYARMGRLIAGARDLQGLTQLQVATRLGVSQQLLAAWETGKRRMPVDLLEPLCDVLRCSTGYLLRGGAQPADDGDPEQ